MLEKEREWSMEELLPIVGRLADKYTSCESSSVTYETARRLMEAVVYCIREQESAVFESVLSAGNCDPAVIYKAGLERVRRKVKEALAVYNELAENFRDYENRYLAEAFRELSRFFRKYDALYAPQDHGILFDYPTLFDLTGFCGIDAVERYIRALSAEQTFLGTFPERFIISVLELEERNYRSIPMNLSRPVLENRLLCCLDGTEDELRLLSASERERIRNRAGGKNREELAKCLTSFLEKTAGGRNEVFLYLSGELRNFIVTVQTSLNCCASSQ